MEPLLTREGRTRCVIGRALRRQIIATVSWGSDERVQWAETKPSLAPLYARYPACSRRSTDGRYPPKAVATFTGDWVLTLEQT